MAALDAYRGEAVPPNERCFALKLQPTGWKARKWRSFDGSVMPMVRLDAEIRPIDYLGSPLHEVLTRFQAPLRKFQLYLEPAAAVPLPLSWSVGRVTFEADRCYGWLHHFLNDTIGQTLATLLGDPGAACDIVLSVIHYEVSAAKVDFAMRDYDVGLGGRLGR
jgi:hypothetical protein